MSVVRVGKDSDWAQVQKLIAAAFAYMEPRRGHPPRAVQVTAAGLAQEAQDGTCWLIVEGGVVLACLFSRPSRDHDGAMYLGKLAVAHDARGRGFARHLVEAAATEARAAGFTALTLDTGDAFPELNTTFARLGFGPPVPRAQEPGVVTLMRAL